MKIEDFDYVLPPERIAQQPAPIRDDSRLLVLNRKAKSFHHRRFSDLPEYLQPGDALVLNETKVMPARLMGRKESGGKVEVLLVREKGERLGPGGVREEEWECLVHSSGKLRIGTWIRFEEGFEGELAGSSGQTWRICLRGGKSREIMERIGLPPRPPYIRRNGRPEMKAEDLERYQTVYARKEGAIAAPTAGLHFTGGLLNRISAQGVKILPLILHVGVGTFLPVRQGEIERHRLEPEFFELPPETAREINALRAAGKRVVAVGTTVTRALESSVNGEGKIRGASGETELFIFPGFQFRVVDSLVTNFHLPRSTLLLLVSAFAGRDLIREAYEEAIRGDYRFYSYGDAMLIL